MLGKLDQLTTLLRTCGRTLVAYSGGVDSVFLAKVAHDALGDNVLSVIADSPSLPRRELSEALVIAEQFGFPVRVIETQEMADANYTANPSNRCYFCKSELFDELTKIAKTEGWQTIVYGENASDVGDYRPGAVAAKEYQVRAPLKEVGLTKHEIRELSQELGLPTADKPQMACLSSRIPYGEPVTEEALRMIEAAENVLRDAGFYDVRVRHHMMENSKFEARNSNGGSRSTKLFLARIEVGVDEVERLLHQGTREAVTQSLKRIGYAYVTLDLQGYRRGSTNEVLMKAKEN
ncbi:MAG TPA: ATP-dependent sacrificial sulfur transferase LarE [Verrucomicrobiae bacterium]|nr:ATP-dependent sacrificial sulfur transferase LarE [Verrucomicrobiae bacterium]